MVNPYSVHNFLFLPFFTFRRRVRQKAVIRVCTVTILGFTAIGALDIPAWAQNGRRGTVPRRTTTGAPDRGTPDRPARTSTEARQADSTRRANARQAIQDRADSIRAARSSGRRPTINWPDRYATRFSERTSRSPFILRDPKAVGTDVRLDNGKNLSVYERVGQSGAQGAGQGTAPTGPQSATGTPAAPSFSPTYPTPGLPFRPGENIPFDSYNRLQNERAQQSLWRDYSAQRDGNSAVKGRGLFPKLELPPVVDRLFGGTAVDFKPNGFVMLDFGYLHQFIDNPQIPVQQRRQGNFIFNEQININFNGKIGERLGMLANFDTKASFNFENALKLNYKPEGLVPNLPGGLPGLPNAPNLSRGLGAPSVPDFTPKNENIIQGLELGNISWPINSQLIPGVQNLFGIKTQLRFGRLNATIVGSQQRSKKQEITIRAGQVGRPFELRADQYDENRHFFLSQFFRDNYERGLKSLPMITTGVTITRVEVYVTNRTNTTESLRNIAGFSDLGENRRLNSPNNPNVQLVAGAAVAANESNTLFARLRATPDIRQVDRTNFALDAFGFQKGVDYDLLRGAKRLTDREYKVHPELGYISLLTPLRNDEVLAVAYEYTYQGRHFKVGELTEDYQNLKDDQVLVLKMIKSATIRNNLQLPMWDLMMKNIYTLSNQQINRQGFQLRIVYKDDQTGIDNPNLQEGNEQVRDKPLVQLFGMDQLNQQLDRQPDGNFDFVENVTVDPRYGRIIFPVLEPFGSYLSRLFRPEEEDLRAKYVFDELYRKTLADAQQLPDRNKFFLRGNVQSASGPTQQLPYGVKEESIQVTAGGVPLTPGGDYIFESSTGQLRILNEGVVASGREIRIAYELPDLFQNQIRRLIGTRLDYALSPDMSIGFTAMNMRETPAGFLTRVAIGNEPVNNTILGFNFNLRRDSPGLTRILDRLPFVQTKEMSTIAFQGEFAQLIPGVAPRVNDNSFIDDFEAARTIYDLTRQPTRWRLGATPLQFPQGTLANPLEYAYNRARISVYSVDQTIYNDNLGNNIPLNLTNEEKQNYYETFFLPTQLFPGRSTPTVVLPTNVLDVAYFPAERGMYNYNPDLNPDGSLKNPRQNFGAVTRAVGSDIDFDNANVETMTFWMMDPFLTGPRGVVQGTPDPSRNRNNTTGGRLLFNLGDISEDVIKDGRYNFENGLKINQGDRGPDNDTTAWGLVTKQQFITNAFQNTEGALEKQDVGLDGLDNAAEQAKFRTFLDQVRQRVSPQAYEQILGDPSNDDFKFYLGPQADSVKYIVARYKQYMGMDGNSKDLNNRNQYLTPSSTNLPDIEDLNIDNTINDNEAYYEYSIDLRPGQLQVGKGYIVDKVETNGTVWYQFRVPVREFGRKVGNINGFKSIRFIRMYLTDFQEPVVLRFGQLQLEANQYRRYLGDLNQRGLQEVPEPYDAQFKVTTVNIEENSQESTTVTSGGVAPQTKYTYTVPPGFIRDRDFTQIANVELNEQSMALSVTNLRDGDSRGAFRITNLDLLFRKRLKMFVHMHNQADESGAVSAFMRVGTDFTDNYYEIETAGLEATPSNITGDPNDETFQRRIWPVNNEIDIALQDLVDLKNARNQNLTRKSSVPFEGRSSDPEKRFKITVVGNPDLSAVQTVMIGIRNPKTEDQQPKTFTIWVNELRTNGYDQTAGRAGVGALNVKLADLGNVTASGKITTFGFGGVQTKVGERTRDLTTEYGVSSALSIDKFFPEKWGLRIPMYLNMDSRRVAPHFDPLDPDNPLEEALMAFPDGSARSAYRRMVEDRTTRRGLNLSNVRKIKVGTAGVNHFYDIENFGFSYAFNDIVRTNILTDQYLQRQYRGGITYTYSPQPIVWEPFKSVKSLERKYLFWLKDFNFNPLPSIVSIRTDVDRSFIKTQLRNSDPATNGLTTAGIAPLFEKYFLFNRYYDLTWNLSKNLLLTYKAQANAIIDEPAGDVSEGWKRDSVWRSVQKLGRMKNYQQDIRFTYRLPLDKFPLTDWIAADVNYAMGYQFQANAYGLVDSTGTSFGNVLRNNRERGITGRIDFVLLYNKIKALRWANTPSPVRKNFARSPGDIEEITRNDNRLIKAATRALLTVRGINFSYIIQESTILPGFLRTPRFFGLDNSGAPGLPFVLGSQDRQIQIKAANNGWTTRSTVLNTAFQQSIAKNFTATTNLEPFKDFRMNIQMRLTRSDAYQEFYRPETVGGDFVSQSPVRNGQFSMSFWSFRTAFKDLGFNPKVDLSASSLFKKFEENRVIIQRRLLEANPDRTGVYNKNAQDVLIPAFFAAYSGQDVEKTKLSPFYNFPLPNWRVDYTGLSSLPGFKKRFSSFTIAHSYSSNYSVGNFISSLDYTATFVNLAVQGYPLASRATLNGDYIPVFVMSTIQMQERFAPLIGVQFQTKNRWSARLEYNQSRDVALNFSNSQVADLTNKDITTTVGFTKNNFKLPFLVNGQRKKLKNDMTFQFQFTLRDTRAIQRKLDGEQIITSGNYNFQIRPTINYVVSRRLNLNLYFDRTYNDPLVLNSYRRATTAGGVQVRFNLAE